MAIGPCYLDEEFLKNVLENGLGQAEIKVIGFDVNLASFGGETYFSDIYRVQVDYQDDDEEPKKVQLVLKARKSVVDQGAVGLKSKEADLYREVIPSLEEILGGDTAFGPKFFIEVKGDYEVYVLQDLNALGYEVRDRQVGLDEEDCILVLKKIAKFHAASIVYAQKFPEVIERIKEAMFEFGTEINPTLHQYMTGMIDSAGKAVATWEGYESVAERVYAFRDVFNQKTRETLDRSKSAYNVINHGDMWVNNILFKDEDTVFIDFQVSNYNSPGLDLNYFLYTSVPLEILKSKRYEFYRIYFTEFEETLKATGFMDIPSWSDFMAEMRRTEVSGAWVMLTIFPMIVMCKDDSTGNDIGTMRNQEVWAAKKTKMYSTQRVEETFKYALDRFYDIGVI